jgi:hypothetical protein
MSESFSRLVDDVAQSLMGDRPELLDRVREEWASEKGALSQRLQIIELTTGPLFGFQPARAKILSALAEWRAAIEADEIRPEEALARARARAGVQGAAAATEARHGASPGLAAKARDSGPGQVTPPVSGGSGKATRTVVWSEWRHAKTAALWEATALSLGIEPTQVKRDRHGWMSGIGKVVYDEGAEFDMRLRMAVRALTQGLDVVSADSSEPSRCVLSLAKFAEWTQTVGWEIPEELRLLVPSHLDAGVDAGDAEVARQMAEFLDASTRTEADPDSLRDVVDFYLNYKTWTTSEGLLLLVGIDPIRSPNWKGQRDPATGLYSIRGEPLIAHVALPPPPAKPRPELMVPVGGATWTPLGAPAAQVLDLTTVAVLSNLVNWWTSDPDLEQVDRHPPRVFLAFAAEKGHAVPWLPAAREAGLLPKEAPAPTLTPSTRVSVTQEPASGRGRRVKRAALIADNERRWRTIERDLKDAATNGLREAAKCADGFGWWWEGSAIEWARERAKVRDAAPGLAGVTSTIHRMKD